jgi:branched-chain amino acid transport system permease protein
MSGDDGMLASGRQLGAAMAAILILVIGASLISIGLGPASQRIVVVAMLAMIATVGMGIFCGNSGVTSFGHVAFMAMGAYTSALLTLPVGVKLGTLPNLPHWLHTIELGLWPAVLVAVAVTMVFALILGLVIGRMDGSAATISTLGLLVIVHGVVIGWRDVTRGAQSFFGVPRETGIWQASAGLILALILARFYRDSVPGLRLRASRENAIAAQSTGIYIPRQRVIAWVISAGVMAAAGALLGHFLGAFSVKKFYFTDTFFLLAMMIVGGASTVTGAVAGTILITVVSEVLRRFEGGFDVFGLPVPAVFGTTQIGIAFIILVTMYRRPQGIFGTKELDELIFPRKTRERLAALPPASAPAPRRGEALHTQGVTMRFGGLVAVNDVSLSIRPGEVIGLIGPNGSGKTTLLNILSGVIIPSSGHVMRGERELTGLAQHRFADKGIARTFQNIRLFSALSVAQNVQVAALGQGREGADMRMRDAVARMGLETLLEAESGTLSYGDQRRVEIARALACQPDFLFLDEPAAGMNREETDALMLRLRDIVREDRVGILLVDHDLKLISDLCERVIVLNEGRVIAEGTAGECKRDPAVIRAYLGTRHGEAT